MDEIWKDILGYEGLYQASNFGRIKSIRRMVKGGNGMRVVNERILKQVPHTTIIWHIRNKKGQPQKRLTPFM